MIDREIAPVTFSIAKFCSSTVALFIKLPLETILRRGQVSILSSPKYLAALESLPSRTGGKRVGSGQLETIVPVGGYSGMFGTMYSIINEEGSRAVATTPVRNTRTTTAKKGKTTVAETVYRRGQGVDGLLRGWKVSWWGLVGLWSAGVLGGGADGEF